MYATKVWMKGLKVNRFGTGFKTASHNHPFVMKNKLSVHCSPRP